MFPHLYTPPKGFSLNARTRGVKALSWFKPLALALLTIFVFSSSAQAWWNAEWTLRKKLTIDPKGASISEAVGGAVLVRLHEGNFQFASAKDDGGDLRFIAADDKTLLPYHIEKFDGGLNEAFVWVKVPEVKPGTPLEFYLYYGSESPKAVRADDSKATFDADTALVYHFSERGAPASDSSAGGNSAKGAFTAIETAFIGSGARLSGRAAFSIEASPALAWSAGGEMTIAAWIKPAALKANALLVSRHENGNAFAFGADNGVLFAEVSSGGGAPVRTAGGTPIAANAWVHVAVVAGANKLTIYLDGEVYASVAAPLPALASPIFVGGETLADKSEAAGFSGELDELEISKVARGAAAVKWAAVSQSAPDKAGKLLAMANDENGKGGGGHSKALEHLMLFGDIAKNMMFDGWIAVGLCVVMVFFGWGVAVRKFIYLNSISKGTEAFMKQWEHVAADLTALDHDDEASVKSMGGKLDEEDLDDMHRSPLFHLYHIGSQEIRHRMGHGKDVSAGLSTRSIQAIKASLESGLVRENQRMNSGLVFLTISIAGGPYVGLLGTVVGVMITFAIIAKSGEVDVNSIAPGIASALLATVAGLVVAIPALFIYSYLSGRIKDLVAGMQVFIDEFIAKMAEFYPTPADRPAAERPAAVRIAVSAEK